METVERAFRLLPSERVLWEGRPRRGVPRGLVWRLIPGLLCAFAAIVGLFAALLQSAQLPGASQVGLVAVYMVVTAIAVWVAPAFILDPCQFMVTDRRILWKRGEIRRSMDRHALTFGRIRWHRSMPTVGTLELVRAVPFGPLARKQRLVFHDLTAPDEVLAMIRGAVPSAHAGDHTTPIAERLDPGEDILWIAVPEGWGIGWRDLATSAIGVAVLVVGLPTGLQSAVVLARFEEHGLPMSSATWVYLFGAMALTAVVILGVGVGMAWYGVLRARAMGRDTQYIVTDSRLLIRRGRTELSLPRERIVDVAEAPGWRGLTHLYLVLDGPEARALADSGALSTIAPSRDAVAPVLYELRDPKAVRTLLTGRDSRPSLPTAA